MIQPFSRILVAFFIMSAAAGAQLTSASAPSRQITGHVRIDGKAAPQGVLIFLDQATAGGGEVPSSRGELGRTMTDSAGRFVLDRLETVGGRAGKERFSVSAHFAGYLDAFEIVDLTFAPRAYVTIEMHRDPKADVPNVPPGGPSEAISARRPASPAAQDAMSKAESLLEKRDPRGSIPEFKKVLKLEPEYGPAYLLLGAAYMQTQDYPEAESAFEKETKLEPGNASGFLGLGASLNQRGDFGSAIKPLQRSLELVPNQAEAHYELGRSYWGLGKWQEAEPHARKALELRKDFAPAHVLMGNISLRHRDAAGALVEFQEYLRLDPQGLFAGGVKEMVAKIEKSLAQR